MQKAEQPSLLARGGLCVKTKREGMTTMTDIPIFYLLGLMLLVNKMRQEKHVGGNIFR